MMHSPFRFLFIFFIVSIAAFVSCTKTVKCDGFPEGLKNYFPNTSLLKFTNTKKDTLKIAIVSNYTTGSRSESNNPLGTGGIGNGDPICIEELRYGSTMYTTFTKELEFYFEITFNNSSKETKLQMEIREPFVSTSGFVIDTINTNTSPGNVFGDTINLYTTNGRFSHTQLIYGKGITKIYDVNNKCEWRRVY